MKQYLYFVCTFLFTSIVLMGCKLTPTKGKTISAFQDKNIKFDTDSMLVVKSTSNNYDRNFKFAFVMYVDSTSCSKCILNELDKWSLYLNEMPEGILTFYPIFTPAKCDRREFFYKCRSLTLPYPVYIDTLGTLVRENPILNIIGGANVFLIDSGGKVLLIGNPTKNPDVRKTVDRIFTNNRICIK